jgi:hypothetical protein
MEIESTLPEPKDLDDWLENEEDEDTLDDEEDEDDEGLDDETDEEEPLALSLMRWL